MTDNRIQEIKSLFIPGKGIARSAFLRQNGVCSKDVQELVSRELLVRVKDGYYCWSDMMDRISDYQIATYTIPNAVICGLSAASIYDMTTVIPDVVHITVPNKGKLPTLPDFPSVELTQMKTTLYQIGITEIEGLPIYNRERTVCDCFRMADSIGTDVTLEILRAYMKGKRDIQKLFEYADQFHITTRIRPYMEVLL